MNILRKYYSVQKDKGYSMVWATLLLPQKVLNRVRVKYFRRSDAIVGFGYYRRPLLASYSRSGTNWLRYIIETLTDLPTPGSKRRIRGDKYAVDRAHQAYKVMHKHVAVILVIRDYRECLIRHNRDLWKQIRDVVPFLEFDGKIEQPNHWYIKNIEAFDKFSGKKMLIYYEDLQTDPEPTIRRVADFFSVDQAKVDDMIAHLDEHYEASVSSYTKSGHDSFTAGTKRMDYHSKSNLTPEQINEFDDYYFNNYPKLAKKYLARYDKRKQKTRTQKSD